MHLTNYSLNRHSSSFDSDERDDHGSKRTLHSFMNLLHKTGHNVAELRAKIHVSSLPLSPLSLSFLFSLSFTRTHTHMYIHTTTHSLTH